MKYEAIIVQIQFPQVISIAWNGSYPMGPVCQFPCASFNTSIVPANWLRGIVDKNQRYFKSFLLCALNCYP
jgi:hypothetical protein